MSSVKVKGIPNLITLGRLIAAILVVILVSIEGTARTVGGVLFLAASLSDMADGYIARSTGQVTEIGKLADPVADKILLLSGVLPLVRHGEVSPFLALVIFSREFAVMGLRCVAAARGKVLEADVGGKLKTALYTVAVTALIFGADLFGLYTLYIGVVISVLSAFNYFRKNLSLLTEGGV